MQLQRFRLVCDPEVGPAILRALEYTPIESTWPAPHLSELALLMTDSDYDATWIRDPLRSVLTARQADLPSGGVARVERLELDPLVGSTEFMSSLRDDLAPIVVEQIPRPIEGEDFDDDGRFTDLSESESDSEPEEESEHGSPAESLHNVSSFDENSDQEW